MLVVRRSRGCFRSRDQWLPHRQHLQQRTPTSTLQERGAGAARNDSCIAPRRARRHGPSTTYKYGDKASPSFDVAIVPSGRADGGTVEHGCMRPKLARKDVDGVEVDLESKALERPDQSTYKYAGTSNQGSTARMQRGIKCLLELEFIKLIISRHKAATVH